MKRLLVEVWMISVILLKTQRRAGEKACLREYININEQSIGRNMDMTGHSGEVPEMRNLSLDSEEKFMKIHIIKCQGTWSNCVSAFYER